MADLQSGVHIFQEIQRVTVDAARGVALPVDQAADRIHTQAVKMELVEPVIGRGLQETAHLTARMDEVTAAPFAFAHVGVRIFIERCAVEQGETVAVDREMHGDKVHDCADARVVQPIDQHFELRRCAIA